MRFSWIVGEAGWAVCTIADERAVVEMTVSYITSAPEQLLTAGDRCLRYVREVSLHVRTANGDHR